MSDESLKCLTKCPTSGKKFSRSLVCCDFAVCTCMLPLTWKDLMQQEPHWFMKCPLWKVNYERWESDKSNYNLLLEKLLDFSGFYLALELVKYTKKIVLILQGAETGRENRYLLTLNRLCLVAAQRTGRLLGTPPLWHETIYSIDRI